MFVCFLRKNYARIRIHSLTRPKTGIIISRLHAHERRHNSWPAMEKMFIVSLRKMQETAASLAISWEEEGSRSFPYSITIENEAGHQRCFLQIMLSVNWSETFKAPKVWRRIVLSTPSKKNNKVCGNEGKHTTLSLLSLTHPAYLWASCSYMKDTARGASIFGAWGRKEDRIKMREGLNKKMCQFTRHLTHTEHQGQTYFCHAYSVSSKNIRERKNITKTL